MADFTFGTVELNDIPLWSDYTRTSVIVAGREATSLSGTPLKLNVTRKHVWTLTFYPCDQLSDLVALFEADESFTFTDHDGNEYTVMPMGEVPINQYPISKAGKMTITLREV